MPAGMYCGENKNELQNRNKGSRRRKDIVQWSGTASRRKGRDLKGGWSSWGTEFQAN